MIWEVVAKHYLDFQNDLYMQKYMVRRRKILDSHFIVCKQN